MKKLILWFALLLVSIATFACHFNPLGECSGNSYFITKLFNPNSHYVFKNAAGDTLLVFNTGDLVIDSVFELPISGNIAVYMDYNYISSDYREYYTNTSSNESYAGCGTTPISLSNIVVKNTGNNVVLTFDAGNETSVKEYKIIASYDNKNWVTTNTIKPTGARHYTAIIGIAGTTTAAVFAMLFIGYKRKKWLLTLCTIALIGVYSCKKDIVDKPTSNYKYYQIQTVDKSGVVTPSYIKVIN